MDKRLLRGDLFGISAAIASGLVTVMMGLLLRRNADIVSTVFIINLIVIALIIRYIITTGRPLYLGLKNTLRISLLGIPLAGSVLFWAYSLMTVNAGISTAIFFTFPLMMPMVTAAVMHDRLSNVAFLGILGGIIGLFFIGSGIINSENASLTGMIYALVAAFFYAIYVVGFNHRFIYPLSGATIALWSLIALEVIFLGLIIARGSFTVPCDLTSWICILLTACLPVLVVYPFNGYCIRYRGYTFTSVIYFIMPISAIVFGGIFGLPITMRTMIGALIIAVAGAVVAGTRNISRHIIRTSSLIPAKRHKH
ncbi:MAG: DMT family transporter [Muribaculaceae bacterium]